ncbi:MAG: recombinase family protein [Phycisphaerales bacterium]|nr:recombinase family protein [Phycisphaerales bacterium]
MTRRVRNNGKTKEQPEVRCAVYTRKSTEEGLEQEYNTLDAQRDSAEAYVSSQKREGWVCHPDHYDDGGFTGGNMERPALKRLLADIESGKVNCVVVYKVDRLSRSLMDFARIMEVFDRHGVSFVSVTQHFNTATSMGRLILNVLLSFAQFERELNSERTRDKIAAARRKGKWSGGTPILGFDIVRSPGNSKLVVNPGEAEQVRHIFETYAECKSMTQTIRRLDALGWRTKSWTTSKGKKRGGRPFDKGVIYHMLTNVLYIGKVRYKDQVFEGEHDAIIDEALFRRVGSQLQVNGRTGGAQIRNKYGALLKGLVRCKACGCAMSHHFCTSDGKRYRYYVCVRAQKRGRATCPAPSLPAGELERFVVDQIRMLAQDDEVIAELVARSQGTAESEIDRLKTERRGSAKQARQLTGAIKKASTAAPAKLADLRDRLGEAERQVTKIDDAIDRAKRRLLDQDEMVGAVEAFDPIWERLNPSEQAKLVKLLVRQVEFDAATETATVTFHTTGIQSLAAEQLVA